jgi:hypothetical protein
MIVVCFNKQNLDETILNVPTGEMIPDINISNIDSLGGFQDSRFTKMLT